MISVFVDNNAFYRTIATNLYTATNLRCAVLTLCSVGYQPSATFADALVSSFDGLTTNPTQKEFPFPGTRETLSTKPGRGPTSFSLVPA